MIQKSIMQDIYEKIKTPYKFGAVIKDEEYLTDSPSVFRYNDKWYMYFIKIHKNTDDSGYETHLASSDDLVNWKYEGKLFERLENEHWDSRQVAGYAAFIDMNFGRSNEMIPVNDKYYMAYLGGNLNGYETDPLSMGLAYSKTPVSKFTRFEEPIMTPFDEDARGFETLTLYKSNMFIDEAMVTGHKYVNAYNTFAVSENLVDWTIWDGEPLVKPELDWENVYAHKSSVVKHDGVVYHYYCAVNDKGERFIALATSKKIKEKKDE